jgi:hypothetical protein
LISIYQPFNFRNGYICVSNILANASWVIADSF